LQDADSVLEGELWRSEGLSFPPLPLSRAGVTKAAEVVAVAAAEVAKAAEAAAVAAAEAAGDGDFIATPQTKKTAAAAKKAVSSPSLFLFSFLFFLF
jgi:hypothetical protein